MRKFYYDLETYSDTPIRQGTYRYAENAEILLFAYAVDDDEEVVVDVAQGEKVPKDILGLLQDPTYLKIMHNSMFDRTVMRYASGYDTPLDQVYDTMIQALMHSLPGGLAQLCEVMRVDAEDLKDKRGKDLIRLFCMPQPKNRKIRRCTYETHPEEWEEFKRYATSDIRATRAIHNKMPKWNYRNRELDLWRLDQRINDRGFAVDRELAEKAIKAVTKAQRGFSEEMESRTLGFVGSALQRDRLLRYIVEGLGFRVPNLQKATLNKCLEDPDIPHEVRELLSIRLEASMSSTSKYKALLNAVNEDGRMRGGLQFCGASRTARWAGRTFQPQNLFRPTLKQYQIDEGIELIKSGKANYEAENVMELCANALRGTIVAPKSKKLVVSDLSNIEGRFAAWCSGESWKVQAFALFDLGIGADLYKVAYGRAFDVDPFTVDDGMERQIGKVMELMLQYGGGVGAYITGAASYRIDLKAMAEAALPAIPRHIKEEALAFWNFLKETGQPTFGLSKKVFVACDSLKRLWRLAHPQIASIWKELEEAFISAIHFEGEEFKVRKFIVRRDGSWLRIRLPSGRYICYCSPGLSEDEQGRIKIYFWGTNPLTRQWSKIYTYGGKLFENVVQAGSRDVMAHNMPLVEKHGYEILLTVHDELINETPDEEKYNAKHLSSLMARPPPWGKDIPLAAGGFEAYRYRKD